MVGIAKFIEGTFLPSREGATNHFYHLCRELNSQDIHLVVFHSYRGWSDIGIMKKERYPIYLFHPETYYKNLSLLCDILKKERIKIMIMNDAEAVFYHGAEIKKRIPSIKIFFEIHDVENILRKKLTKRDKEVKKTIKIEKEALKIADFYTCFTNFDKKQLLGLGAKKKDLYVIPSGVDIKETTYSGPSLNKLRVLFLGNNYYEPNSIAIKSIKKRIYPFTEAKFLIGGNAPSNLTKLQEKDFEFLGYLKNLNEFFKKGTVAIAPINVGSGIRLKILNYMAAGLPVISTSLAAEGIKKSYGLIICNNIDKYPDIINTLFHNPAKLRKMGFANRRVIEKYYSWEIIGKKIINLLDKYSQ